MICSTSTCTVCVVFHVRFLLWCPAGTETLPTTVASQDTLHPPNSSSTTSSQDTLHPPTTSQDTLESSTSSQDTPQPSTTSQDTPQSSTTSQDTLHPLTPSQGTQPTTSVPDNGTMECEDDHVTSHVTESGSVFVVKEPISSVVHTLPVRQVPQTGLSSSEEQEEQVMETEEVGHTQSQTSQSVAIRSFTPPPDSIPSDIHSQSTEQTDSQSQANTTTSVTSEEGGKTGEGERERERSDGHLPSHNQAEVSVNLWESLSLNISCSCVFVTTCLLPAGEECGGHW